MQGRNAAPRVSPLLHTTDLKSRENQITEEVEGSGEDKEKRLSGGFVADSAAAVDSQKTQGNQTDQLGKRLESTHISEDSSMSSSPREVSDSGIGSDATAAKSLVSSRINSSFAPLKAPVQQLSSLLNYTTSFFKSGGDKEAKNSPAAAGSQEGEMDREIERLTHSLPQDKMRFPQVQSAFTKEELSKCLGPEKCKLQIEVLY